MEDPEETEKRDKEKKQTQEAMQKLNGQIQDLQK